MSAVINPYAPPKAHVHDVTQADSEADEIRQEHIKHETSVRSIGILYYLSGGALCLGSIGLFSMAFSAGQPTFIKALGPIYLVFGILALCVARGLRKLRPWARITSSVLAGIGLLGFPVGTLINGYILYLLLSKKGKRIFEDDYADIIAATPHVKHKTSVVTWIALGILVLVLLGIMAAVMFRR